MDRVSDFFNERTPRRIVALACLAGLLVLFRHLLPLLVFFVTFERAIGSASAFVVHRTAVSRKVSLLGITAILLGAIVASAVMGVGKTLRTTAAMHRSFPEHIAEVRDHPLYLRVRDQLGDTDRLIETAKHYAGSALQAALAVGHVALYATIGLIVAVVFLLEEQELKEFHGTLAPRSLHATLIRWIGHIADATVVTVQLQVIVAACNALLTLPVLLLLRIPHVGALMILIFVSALVPIVGNMVSGAVLSVLAYHAKGWLGVGLFVGLTFVLHKVEAYYLNPRLTARHVKLPGFVLIVSLLLWEHVLGFAGLFVSFPFLFVAGKIRSEFEEEDGKLAASRLAAVPTKR